MQHNSNCHVLACPHENCDMTARGARQEIKTVGSALQSHPALNFASFFVSVFTYLGPMPNKDLLKRTS